MRHAEVVAVAERALSARGIMVELRLDDVVIDYPGARALILRCSPSGPAPQLPPTVIVKCWNEPGSGGYQQELTALDFLGTVPDVNGLVPALYGYDLDAELLVMADVDPHGQGPDADPSRLTSPQVLGNILFGADTELAEAALLAFNGALGHLHGATVGRAAEFRCGQEHWPATTKSKHGVHRLLPALAELPDLLAANDVAVSAALGKEIDAATAAIGQPGDFLAFTHGDSTPSNALYADGRVRLLDFETAEFRNVLADGCFAPIRYLYSVWARRIPEHVRRAGLTAYRAALAEGCPAAADDDRFGHALLACAAGWLAVLCGHLPAVADADVRWGRSTDRQRIVTGADHFVGLTAEYGGFHALADAADALGRRLRDRWPPADCTMKSYPALAGPT